MLGNGGGFMRRTMIFLPDEIHKGLRYLAVRNETSLASLIREAVAEYYTDELKEVKIAQERLSHYIPGTGIPLSKIKHGKRH